MFDATIITPIRLNPELFDDTHIIRLEWDFEKSLSKNCFLTWSDMLNLNVRTATPETVHKIGIAPQEKIVMSDFFWYAFKKEKAVELFKGKDIIIVSMESKPNGYQYMDQYWGHPQKDTLSQEHLSNFNNVTYIIDNSHPGMHDINPDINFLPSHSWSKQWLQQVYPESPIRVGGLLKKADSVEEHNWSVHWEKMNKYFEDWNTLAYDYTLSLGTMKTFRVDLFNKIKIRDLDTRGQIGTYCDTWDWERLENHQRHFSTVLNDTVEYSNFPNKFKQLPDDRKDGYDRGGAGGFTYNETCLYNSKLELIVESVAESSKKFIDFGVNNHNGEPFPISQLTEKTSRMLLLGKPFLLVTTNMLYEQLEEWGFDWYRDIFGDYRGKDFEETNSNVCDILSDLKNGKEFNIEQLQRISKHNYDNIAPYIADTYGPQYVAKLLNF